MSSPPEPAGAIERTRRAVSIVGLSAIVVCLAAGLTLSLAGRPAISARVFTVAATLLLALPLVGVGAVLAEEIRRRDWIFAAAALGVLALIGYQVLPFARRLLRLLSGD